MVKLLHTAGTAPAMPRTQIHITAAEIAVQHMTDFWIFYPGPIDLRDVRVTVVTVADHERVRRIRNWDYEGEYYVHGHADWIGY